SSAIARQLLLRLESADASSPPCSVAVLSATGGFLAVEQRRHTGRSAGSFLIGQYRPAGVRWQEAVWSVSPGRSQAARICLPENGRRRATPSPGSPPGSACGGSARRPCATLRTPAQ